ATVPASQSLISKIDRGERLPGRDLMEKLALLHGVNASWVLRGEGEPFQGPSKGTLPIAVGILPGWPERYTELLTGQRHPVAQAFHRASRYWVRLTAGCPLARKAELALREGDLLLVDSNRDLWALHLPQRVGSVLGVCLRRGEFSTYSMGVMGK